ncbi:ribonuclease III [Marinomonas mediterranea]|uniref:Ribonuclease 3 n=1 Tax=Marinomonas mediterranea (strain ATCC 700492 / JCM 21426 / NBRC 103028 / MMB-1) TaxID=717774 RepID=F2JTW8_MARM1|nr:ribonuclease III [Marinomonas mediterranea]ADZ90389.1 Ribonuclease 3 [Marinomonas mediterranea MMB-1]WCN08445.1 ribonuclease III [Marinomonas mediterranea]WCN12499.1 ribonuclease III [Marinomonas mediterranea]WCN16571.1 ribonuclease III [Marinomonas mediterranea MMB-1]
MSSLYQKLCRRIGYFFADLGLLELALTHRSYGGKNNERLEFLGDSILNYVIAEDLFHRFPKAKEGELSRLRASLVKGDTLAELAREFQLGDFLKLGAGELKSGGFRRDSILADTVEGIIGAMYLDAGMDTCKNQILEWYKTRLDATSLNVVTKDAKTRLQEYLQARKHGLPQYEVVNIDGEPHDQTFFVHCHIEIFDQAVEGKGNSRRIAEQNAAAEALSQLEKPNA